MLTFPSPALFAPLTVTLSGEGVSPSLSMEPADGVLDLGNVMAGDSATGVATLRNNSLFPLGFSVLGAAKLCSACTSSPALPPSSPCIASGLALCRCWVHMFALASCARVC